MKKESMANQRARGNAVIERLAAESLPSALRAPAKEFKDAQRDVDRATDDVETAREARDTALEKVAEADAALDGLVDALADALVGWGVGTRRSPFASFTKRTVSDLVSLAYATEAKEVRALCAAVRRKKPAAAVAKVVAQCEKQVDAVERAIASLDRPQAAFAKALARRDALLPEWTRKLARLKRHAAVVWEDEPDLLKATFAEPGLIAAPKTKRKKPAPAVVNGTPSAPVVSPATP